MNDTVLLAIEAGIATLTLNRPKALNALDAAMVEGLTQALDRIEAEREARVVIIEGSGGGFMAGGDLRGFSQWLDLPPAERKLRFERFIGTVHPQILRLRRLPQPVVASVYGPVAGFGLSLMLACDLAVAAENSVFTLAYSLIGTSPDGGSSFFLPRQVGMKKAMEIALLGDRFDAAMALRLGLVNEVVPLDRLKARTGEIAARLATGPSEAYAATKRLINGSMTATLETQLQAEMESFASCSATGDFVEGITAFLGKRPARFGGGVIPSRPPRSAFRVPATPASRAPD